MSAPFSNSDARRDGWDFDTADDEVRAEQDEVDIAVEVPSPRIRQMYRELGPLASGVHVNRGRAPARAARTSHGVSHD